MCQYFTWNKPAALPRAGPRSGRRGLRAAARRSGCRAEGNLTKTDSGVIPALRDWKCYAKNVSGPPRLPSILKGQRSFICGGPAIQESYKASGCWESSCFKKLLRVNLSEPMSKHNVSTAAVPGKESNCFFSKIKGRVLLRAMWNINVQLFRISCGILLFTTQFSLLFYSKQWRFSIAHWGHPNWKSLKYRFQL